MKLTLEDITKQSPGGHLLYVELIKAAGVDTGEVGSLEYSNWGIGIITENQPLFKITNKNRLNQIAYIYPFTGMVTSWSRINKDHLFIEKNEASVSMVKHLYEVFNADVFLSIEQIHRLNDISESFNYEDTSSETKTQTGKPCELIKKGIIEWKGSSYRILSTNEDEHFTVIAPLFSDESITIPHLFYIS